MIACEYKGWALYQTYKPGLKMVECRAEFMENPEKEKFNFSVSAQNLTEAIEQSTVIQELFTTKVDEIQKI